MWRDPSRPDRRKASLDRLTFEENAVAGFVKHLFERLAKAIKE